MADLNFNANPYYDDFDETKNYMKILFKPGYAVQARELTQLQTALQTQISRFGSHIFKDGSIVLNGQTTVTKCNWIDLEETSVPLIYGITYTGVSSGAKGIPFLIEKISNTTYRMYFTYTSGLLFEAGEDIVADETGILTIVADPEQTDAHTGDATAYSIVDSVFFVRGHFVFCEAQTIILNDTTATFTKRVGLNVTEAILDSVDDTTLLDPARGSYNYAAPGADRYSITLELVSFTYDPQESTDLAENFIELSRFESNQLVYNVTTASYADLETTLARRTYDESGDYTVKAFNVKVVPHIFGDTSKMSLAIEPGKAYVKGYEFETIATTYIDLDRATATLSREDSATQVDYGTYFVVKNITGPTSGGGNPNVYNSNQRIALMDGTVPTAVQIGTAYIRGIDYHPTVLTAAGAFIVGTRYKIIEVGTTDWNAAAGTSGLTYTVGSLFTAAAVGAGTGKAVAVYQKVYLFNIEFISGKSAADVRTLESIPSGWSATLPIDAGEVYDGGKVYLFSNKRRSAIIPIANSSIKTLEPSETMFIAQWPIGVTVSSSTTITAPVVTGTTSSLPFDDVSDYIVVGLNGSTYEIGTVTAVGPPVGNSRTLSVSGVSGAGYVFAKVLFSDMPSKAKTLTTGTLTAVPITSALISLEKADCYKLSKVIAKDTAPSPVADYDITNMFEFNTGQKDDVYDHGWIKLKAGAVIPADYDVLDIEFQYFSVSSSGINIFTVDSYAGFDNSEIPSYTASDGTVYNLRDCIDFRPRRDDGATVTTVTGVGAALPGELITTNYEYYIPRIDKLVLTKERKFAVLKGIPAEHPATPNDMFDAMTLYVINLPPYTNDPDKVSIDYIDNRRYTMRDIGKIEKRVERIEYYTTLSLLEKQAKDEQIYDSTGVLERFKNGILVDSFNGHSVGDVNNPDYSCSIEPETRTMRSRFAPFSYDYNVVGTSSSNVKQEEDLVTLDYTLETFIVQPDATRTVNLNPYLVFPWNGTLHLFPQTDTWVDTQKKPDVLVNLNGVNDAYTILTNNVKNPASVGVRWNDWQTVTRGTTTSDNLSSTSSTETTKSGGRTLETTETVVTNNTTTTITDTLLRTGVEIKTSGVSTIKRDLGTKVVDTSLASFIRSRVVRFNARKMKPETKLIATFDGVDVTEYCHPAEELIFTAKTVIRGANRVRTSDLTKQGKVALTSAGRTWVLMDKDSESFVAGDVVQWLVDGAVSGTSTIVGLNGVDSNGKTWVNGGVVKRVNLSTNEFGDLVGTFRIPNNDKIRFRIGERAFKLSDGVGEISGTAAEAKYVALGMTQSTQRTIVATRVEYASVYPTLDVKTRSKTTKESIVVSDTQITRDVTPPKPPQPPLRISCGAGQSGTGASGRFEYVLDFGPNVGTAGISFRVNGVPDRYTIIWDGKTYTSGFVGSNTYDPQLQKLGLPKVKTNASSGFQSLTFSKTKTDPQTARLVVNAPLKGTAWNFSVICPDLAPVIVEPPPIPSVNVVAEISGTTSYTPLMLPGKIDNDRRAIGNFVIGSLSTHVAANSAVSKSTTFRLTSVSFVGAAPPNITIGPYDNTTASPIGTDRPFTLSYTSGEVVKPAEFTIRATWTRISGESNTASISTVVQDKTITVRPEFFRPTRIDPVAQSFFVDARVYPNGVFVRNIDLFFKTKSNSAPVTIQIRPTVNGYPSADTILPFATAIADAEDVNVSADGTTATTFTFENLVHLSPGEYAFVVIADSKEYEMYSSRIGEFSVKNANKRITEQKVIGSMFKSQNASTWTAVQEEDVKFRLRKAVFDISSPGIVVFNTDVESDDGDIDYDVFYTTGEVVDFADTDITYQFKPYGSASWIDYQLGTNVDLDERKTLLASNGTSLQFKTTLSSIDRNVSPVIDTKRLSSVLVQNLINDESTAAPILAGSFVIGTEYKITDLGTTDWNIVVGTTGLVYTVGQVITAAAAGSGTGKALTTERNANGGDMDSRYITRKVKLNPGFEATDLKVYFNANIPVGTYVDVYYKVATAGDPIFDDNMYHQMVVESASSFSETGYPEYKYKTPYLLNDETRALPNGDKFDTFAIKIVMRSTNTVKVPKIRDLRAIALDD